jgi:hypothetical protein
MGRSVLDPGASVVEESSGLATEVNGERTICERSKHMSA